MTTTQNLSPAEAFDARMRGSREDVGLSQEEATYGVREYLPRSEWVSKSTIVRLENGQTPEEKASPALVAALARVYGVPLEKLSAVAAEGLATVASLAGKVEATGQYARFSLIRQALPHPMAA